MPTDLAIAHSAKLQPIQEIAAKLNLPATEIEPFGRYKAKLPLQHLQKSGNTAGKLVLVSAMTPTPAGEGKTTTSIGLAMAMQRIGLNTTVVLREPSLGPVFGIKGGAAGGGYSQVVPMEDINLHFTGDFAAVEKAHNLLAALIDNHLHHGNALGLDVRRIRWKRVMDMNDRALRNVTVGRGGLSGGVPRETGFDITAASEIMAILCLANGPAELKTRLGNILVGLTRERKPVYARDLHAQGPMAVLLREALQPNLVQTLENTPAILHGGPFANIAQGTNTVLATRMGMALSDWVVTEAGFGFDLGGEKFLNIKARLAELPVHAVVLVATLRALKYHGGVARKELNNENLDAVSAGLPNLEKHLENIQSFGLSPVVAVNRFTSDTDAEVQLVTDRLEAAGYKVVPINVWAEGGNGALELAEHVKAAGEAASGRFQPTYPLEAGFEEKMTRLARTIYGAAAIELSSRARADLRRIRELGLEHLPICTAKTQNSLSDNPKALGRPEGFTLHIREIELAAGAGFLIPLTGQMMRMPGLPATPAAEGMDLSEEGEISGLS